MTLQLGWFAEDFKLLSNFKQLILKKVGHELSNMTDPGSIQNGIFTIEEETSPCNWMRIILPHGLSTAYQLTGICTLKLIEIFRNDGFTYLPDNAIKGK